MGVVNVTPDSFSDGGRFVEPDAAVAQARRLASEGADLVDIGGESTRPPGVSGPDDPGATPVSVEDELRRVLPVIERLAAGDLAAPISIDTHKRPPAGGAGGPRPPFGHAVTAPRRDPR